MSTRSGRIRPSAIELSPPRARKRASQSRSPARTRKSSPPSRSPSRKSTTRKSPSRKPASKFPARKSPSRTTKESEVQKSPGKRLALKTNVEVKLVDVSSNLDSYRSTRGRRTEYSVKDISSNLPQNEYLIGEKVNGVDSLLGKDVFGIRNRKLVEEVIPRRSSRLRDFLDNVPDITRSLSKSVSKSVSKSISQSVDTYSDEENSDEDVQRIKRRPVTRKLATPVRESVTKLSQITNKWEFGGRFGSLALILLIPIVVVVVLISCSKACTFRSLLDLSIFKSAPAWFGVEAFLFVSSQVVLQAIFALLPVCGKKMDTMNNTGTKYCFNAFFSSIMTTTALFALDFFKLINSNTLLDQYLKLATVSYIIAVVLAVGLYVKSRNMYDVDLNSYGNTGYVFYDFFIGREIHPRIKRLDVKVWVSRISNITTLILAVLVFKHGIVLSATDTDKIELQDYKELLSKVQLKPTILLYSLMQIVYILSFIIKEHKVTTTFFWQCEGMGYLQIVASLLYPFYFTSICKFVADTKLALSTNILVASSVLYLLGYFVILISNNIKHEFRVNPLSHKLTNLETMPTFHGKKLLVSGLWRVLRHPNYAGDILIHIALSLPGIITQHWIAAAPALLTILVLLHRAWRDHSRCSRRYGAAWQRYCKRVPSVIIPKVL